MRDFGLFNGSHLSHRRLFPMLVLLALCAGLSGCAAPARESITPPAASAATVTAVQLATARPTAVISQTPLPAPAATRTVQPTPLNWQEMPVVPLISARAVEIYRDGLSRGHNPRAFSKVGDCEARTTWFLADFDAKKPTYDLGPYAAQLEPVILYYQGSFNRLSLVARPGFNAASILAPLWADPKLCQQGETPLGCEYRLHNPNLALIMLGTNDVSRQPAFESNMRKIIEFSISQGVLPVLATKADNLEGDGSINATIARLAQEYDVPLWNYWRAVQGLPSGGLQEDGAHLTFGNNTFGDAAAMQKGWPVRNLTALQTLAVVLETVGE